MNPDEDLQVAFEDDTLDAAVQEVMRLGGETGQDWLGVAGTGHRYHTHVADEVRDYLMQTSQITCAESGRATAGSIRKIVYRTVGVVFEPIMQGELDSLVFSRAGSPPVHVAQFWQRLGQK